MLHSSGKLLLHIALFYVALNLYFCAEQVNIGGYQVLQTACGQNVVYVNGQYRLACPNGFLNEYNVCVAYAVPQCPQGYHLWQGLCYLQQQLPTQECPSGYYLMHGICYPLTPPPCATEAPSIDSTPIPVPQPQPQPEPEPESEPEYEPETEPEPDITLPEPDYSVRCPVGSVLMENKCRKILCPLGEYYEGRCLQPICPEGTVWRGRRCQPPGYVTTILEIDNVFINEAHERRGHVVQTNSNNVQTPKPLELVSTTTPSYSPRTTSRWPTTTATAATTSTTRRPKPTPTIKDDGRGVCCTIFTPRICKIYSTKWVCFHRRIKQCDAQMCTHPKMYLRVSEVVYDYPVLVMPPNPPLEVCSQPGCDNTDTLDCSGCRHNRRETCSPQCYLYQCPHGECDYVDLKDYCNVYPGEFGCTKEDGCIWDWCKE